MATNGTPWDFDEYARLMSPAAQIDTATLVVVLLGGDAGLRAGEMRALEWTDLDFVKRQIRIERSDWRGKVTSTKGNRVRYVPMTRRLASALQVHRHLKNKRVLCDRRGKPIRANGLAYLLERATRKAGLASSRKPRHAGPHVLRHTFCSHLSMREFLHAPCRNSRGTAISARHSPLHASESERGRIGDSVARTRRAHIRT